MRYVQPFYQRDFSSEEPKDAFLKANEFIAKNILSKSSKVEVEKVTWTIRRHDNTEQKSLPTFRLTIFYMFDDTEFMQSTCEACKQFHKSFFINENFNCSRCNKVGYEKNVKQKLDIGSVCLREKLDDELNKF